jgi:hypothetical protein
VRRLSFVALLIVFGLTFSSCYYRDALEAERTGAAMPWWCKSTEEIPVTTGPAVGTVDWYAGTHKQPLTWDQCKTVSGVFDLGAKFANQWPTAADAEANGFRKVTSYVGGMGTHHLHGVGITPAMLADPNFNRQNPILDSTGLDDQFDPTKPEVLQYDGNGPSAKLVGFDYYVRTNTGLPPAGFPGNQDWWHHHPVICYRKTDAEMIAFNVSDASCTSQNGVNVNMSNYYMLHVWVLEDMTFEPDVYAGMIPCISGGTAVHDPNHWCHTSRTSPTAAAIGAGLRTAAAAGPAHRGARGLVCTLAA